MQFQNMIIALMLVSSKQKEPKRQKSNTHTFMEFFECSNFLKWKLSVEDANNQGRNFNMVWWIETCPFPTSALYANQSFANSIVYMVNRWGEGVSLYSEVQV